MNFTSFKKNSIPSLVSGGIKKVPKEEGRVSGAEQTSEHSYYDAELTSGDFMLAALNLGDRLWLMGAACPRK